MGIKILHVRKVSVLTILPIITHTVLRAIRVVVLLTVGIINLLEVFRLEIISRIFSSEFSGSTLFLLQSVLLLSSQFNIVFFKSSLISPES